MGFYTPCPYCGSNLDPGEKCDCQNKKAKEDNGYDEAEKDCTSEKAS